MDFLKRVVPPVLSGGSGDLVSDAREETEEGTSPRLLKVRRLCSTASERRVGDPGGNKLCGNHDGRCLQQQIGKVKRRCFGSFKNYPRKGRFKY